MLTYDALRAQTLTFRATISQFLGMFAGREREMPPTWRNNALWHAGHLVVTLRIITFGLAGEPLGIDENYKKWFRKGTSPADWNGAMLPGFEQLRREIVEDAAAIFETFRGREDAPYSQPYKTTAGVVLGTPAEGLTFSQTHDAMHMGMLFVLKGR